MDLRQRRLPKIYKELEYLQSSGTQYIDTGVIGTQNTSYEIKALTTVGNTTPHMLFGARSGYTSNNIGTHFITDTNKLMSDFNTTDSVTRTTFTVSTNKIYTIYNSSTKKYIIDNETGVKTEYSTTFSGTITTQSSMYLFHLYGMTGTISLFEGKIYYCKIWNNGTLIKNLIPAQRISDSVLGMYDTVTDTFLTNAGTGTFTAGAEVKTVDEIEIDNKDVKELLLNSSTIWKKYEIPSAYTRKNYIQSPPSATDAYINTGLYQTIDGKASSARTQNNIETEYVLSYLVDTMTRRLMGSSGDKTNYVGISTTNYFEAGGANTSTVKASLNTIYKITSKQTSTKFDFSVYDENGTLLGGKYNYTGYNGWDNTSFGYYSLFKLTHYYLNSYSTRLYRAKFWIDGTLMRDFIPVMKNSNSEYGMYDTVTCKFYGNAGAGSFTGG